MGWPDEREGAADGTARAGDAGGVSFRISGNTISGPFAAGYHAQATQWNQPTDELLARLDDALRERWPAPPRSGPATTSWCRTMPCNSEPR